MPKVYVVHYATSNPFSQYVQLAHLTAAQVRVLISEFKELQERGVIHSYLVEPCSGSEVIYSALVQQLAELVTPACDPHHLSRRTRVTDRT